MLLFVFNMGATRGATQQFSGTLARSHAQPQMVGDSDDDNDGDNGDIHDGDKWNNHYAELARLARQAKVKYNPGLAETQLEGKSAAWVLT